MGIREKFKLIFEKMMQLEREVQNHKHEVKESFEKLYRRFIRISHSSQMLDDTRQ